MPKLYKRRSRKGYRRYRRKKKVSATRNMGPLQVKLPSKLIYAEQFSLNPGVGGTNDVMIFSCNGMYDPNITSTGHQPRGFDELMALYDHYTVIGAKITIDVVNTDTTTAQMVTLSVHDFTSTSAVNNDYLENRYIKKILLAPEPSGSSKGRVSIKLNPNKYLGVSKPLAEDTVKGSATANPTEQCYFHVTGFPVDGVTDTSPIQCVARIEYYSIWTEPKQPAQS